MRARAQRWWVGALVAALMSVGMVATGPASPAGAAATAPASTPIGARVAWAQTNGDILAITKVAGVSRDLIAFGGNFTAVITPDGVSHPATNFAVVDEFTGAVVYAGNANSYVRAISSKDGILFVGGDFTSFGGVARNRLVALSSTFAVTSWNPAPSFRVRAVVAGSRGVYYGGDGSSVRLVNPTSGAVVWSQSHTGGSVRALAVSPDNNSLYVGGLFETYGTLTRHGLIKASATTGAPDTGFNANFRLETGVGPAGSYDGEAGNVLQLTPDGSRLLVGVAGQGSDEFKVLNPTTGGLTWVKILPGDCQAFAIVGSTYVVGYHRNNANGTIPYPNFAAQLESTNNQLTTWDPGLTGIQSNADGGNNGVQAMYADPVNRRLFVAGAFTTENGRPLKSLAAYTWGAATNQPPVASFSSSTSGLTASFNGTASSDPGGSISSYSWNFGDGTQGTGASVQHTYAAAGTYTVTLQVTDNQGATGTRSAPVTVTVTAPSNSASDSFNRTVASGFGTADAGGPWTTTGTASRYSVANGVGTMAAAPGSSLRADLLGLQQTSINMTSTATVDAAPAGGGTYVALVGRRVNSTNDYRLKVRLQAGGAVAAQLVRVVGGTETAIQTVGSVPGLTYAVGDVLRLRLVVDGTGSTALRAKVWKNGTSEPSAWLLQATDNTAALQAPGSIGYWYYLSSASTPNPTRLSVDNLAATSAG
ncbi:hypothetical protein BH09ACT10_BH09ACT10_11120 [soil metagenome]